MMQTHLARYALLALFFLQATFVISAKAEKCGAGAVDVVFVLDESGSIWGPHFKQQLQFVQDLIDGFDIRPDGTRVGVETFGSEVRTIVELGEIVDAEQLKRKIGGIQQLRGTTGTHLALTRLWEMFSGVNVRPDASRVAVVITDGESDNPQLTAIEAEAVHAQNIAVFAIGVGVAVKREELERIASQPDYVFTVGNYSELNSLLSVLAVKACPVEDLETTTKSWPEPAPAERTEEWRTAQPSTPRPWTTKKLVEPFTWPTPRTFPFRPVQPKATEGCEESVTFNVYYGLPDQLSAIDTYLALQFIRDLTTILSRTPSFIRPTLCPRICPPAFLPPRSCEPSSSLDFLSALDERRADAVTRNDLQLEYIRKQEEGYRRRYPVDDIDLRTAIAVMLLDNRLADMELTMRQVVLARREGIQVVAIGVGDYVDPDELWRMAATERDLIYLPSYNQLPTIRDAVLQRVCIRGLVQSAGKSVL